MKKILLAFIIFILSCSNELPENISNDDLDIKNNEDINPGFNRYFFFVNKNNIKNNIRPSKAASYNCEGCLGILSILTNITDHITSVCLPYSSELMKFEILPKKIPMGAEAEIKSKNIYLLTLCLFEKIIVAIKTPIRPP